MNIANLKLRRIKITRNKTHGAIAIVGLGYVGLPLALLAERKGFTVHGIDIDTKKITMLQGGGHHS